VELASLSLPVPERQQVLRSRDREARQHHHHVDEEDATGDRWKVTRPQNAFNRPRTLRRLTSGKSPGHERILRILRGQQR
jgi:hypothetical protein